MNPSRIFRTLVAASLMLAFASTLASQDTASATARSAAHHAQTGHGHDAQRGHKVQHVNLKGRHHRPHRSGNSDPAPGTWTGAQVMTAEANGVTYLGTQQNTNGSFGSGATTIAFTGMALLAYGVISGGNFNSLSTSNQTHVKDAITYLLAQQHTTGVPT